MRLFIVSLLAFSAIAATAAASWFYDAPMWLSVFLTVLAVVCAVGWWVQKNRKWALLRAMLFSATLCIGSAAIGWCVHVQVDTPPVKGEGTYGITSTMALYLLGAGLVLYVLGIVVYVLIRSFDLKEERLRQLAAANASGGYAPLGASIGAGVGVFLGPIGAAAGGALGAFVGRMFDESPGTAEDASGDAGGLMSWLFGPRWSEVSD